MLVLGLDPWIANAIATINTYVAGGRETFLRERLVQDAVVRNFEIIAEAADRLSPDLRAVSPVPWATHYPIGSNEMRSRMPVAAATRSSVRVDGFVRPLSRRAITACVVPMRRAS
jgi:hypothetical protein